MHKNTAPENGLVLVSQPLLGGAYFMRSIVLIVEHGKQGTTGFVLNNIMNVSVDEVIAGFPLGEFNLVLGGPVESHMLYFIHTLGERIPHSQPVTQSIYWGGDIEVLRGEIIAGRVTSNQVKFFVGYAGWSDGQLDEELAEGSWVLTNLDDCEIMSCDCQLWQKAVMRLCPTYHYWINFPRTPHFN